MTTMPEQLRRSLTWDRGKELAQHATADRPWHRGLLRRPPQPLATWHERNTNGLLRQYFPKKTDLSRWSTQDFEAVASTLNSRPRKTLG